MMENGTHSTRALEPNNFCQRIMEWTIRAWLCQNLVCPYPWPRALRSLCQTILARTAHTDGPPVTSLEITQCLDRLRQIEWPQMVYEAGMIPVGKPLSNIVWAMARPQDLADVCCGLGEKDAVQIIPRQASALFNGEQRESESVGDTSSLATLNPTSTFSSPGHQRAECPSTESTPRGSSPRSRATSPGRASSFRSIVGRIWTKVCRLFHHAESISEAPEIIPH